MATKQPPKVILEIPLSEVNGCLLDISPVATPCRFRFIDCHAVHKEQLLRLVEVPQLPRNEYSAISYVWRGNRRNSLPEPQSGSGLSEPLTETSSFVVKGAEGGDPISIDLLRYACIA